MAAIPSVRWGILGTGMISSWFVEDLVLQRPGLRVNHIIQAIGSSSVDKGRGFANQYCPKSSPTIHGSYDKLIQDPDVDIIYIGIPHGFHKDYCLRSINAKKAVLCEKAFTLNATEAKGVFQAAEKHGVYVQEAMWLRHRPLVQKLRALIHDEKAIGEPFRMFADFSIEKDIQNLPLTSRYRDPSLGAGSLLDIGIYSLTWAILTLDAASPANSEVPKVLATQSFEEGIEVNTSVILHYATTGRQAVTTSTTNRKPSGVIARVDGRDGYIEIEGPGGSMPRSLVLYKKCPAGGDQHYVVEKTYDFPEPGRGFYYEADNTALDYLAGRKESSVMPWAETIRVMELMDEIRRQGGTRYSVD